MAFEQYANSAKTTLNGAINNSQTTLVVNSATGFPTVPNFRIIIESELLLVTAVSGTTWTVTRGVESTTGASHADGLNVVHILTAASIQALFTNFDLMGPFGSIPAAGTAGRWYTATDSFITARDNGSSWDYFAWGKQVFPPDPTTFSWNNQGANGNYLTTYGGTLLYAAGTNATDSKLLYKSTLSAPYSVQIGFIPYSNNNSTNGTMGLMFRESSSGKQYSFDYNISTGAIATRAWSSASAVAFTDYNGGNQLWTGQPMWMKWTDDNTNRIAYVSFNGLRWTKITSISRTSYITPNQVGFYYDPRNLVSTQEGGIHVFDFSLA